MVWQIARHEWTELLRGRHLPVAGAGLLLVSIVNFHGSTSRYDPQQDYGPSTFDVRHALSGAVSYDLPTPFRAGLGRALLGGFAVDAIFGFRTATP